MKQTNALRAAASIFFSSSSRFGVRKGRNEKVSKVEGEMLLRSGIIEEAVRD